MTDAMKVMVVILVVWVGLCLARLTREVRKPYWNPKPTLSDPERMRKPGRVPGDAEKAETK
jgi:hypothetical protein